MRGGALARRPCGAASPLIPAMLELLLGAVALMLVFEGLLPFLESDHVARGVLKALRLSDGQIRFLGLSSMLIGLLLLVIFWR